VRLPAGRYLSGPLHLRSDVHLHLEAGSRLLASTDPRDYGAEPGVRGAGSFLVAEDADNVGISGPGVIDGQATENFNRYDPRRGRLDPVPLFRVRLVRFDRCRDVRVRDLTLRHSDGWTLHLRRCDRVWVEGVSIRNNVHRLNSDGIDPDSSRNVHISNCHIVAGDDCIACKTSSEEPCENVVITNCTMETTCTWIKFGTESHGDFRDIHVSNCVLRNTSSGIAFHMKDGATMERITLSSISYEEREEDPVRYVASPLLMDVERRHADTPVGTIRDVTIRDFYAESRMGGLIQGMPGNPIRNLTLSNFHLRVEDPWDFQDRQKRIAGTRTTQDGRDTLHARKPAYMTLAHVEGAVVEGLRVEIAGDIFRGQPRSALWLADVRGERVRDVDRLPRAESPPAVRIENGSGNAQQP
jgi:polygalacturonase